MPLQHEYDLADTSQCHHYLEKKNQNHTIPTFTIFMVRVAQLDIVMTMVKNARMFQILILICNLHHLPLHDRT